MHKIECPFHGEFCYEIKCPYMNSQGMCSNIECGPGNGDAWCGQKIREALDKKMKKEPGTPTRQNYSCNICGLKSFVVYDSKDDAFEIATKIGEDHKRKEPTCPSPPDDLNLIGFATAV